MRQPKHITVIGAGFMGCVIATIYARHGFDVVLHDAVPGMLGSFTQRALPIAHSLGTPKLSPEDMVSRVRLVETLEAAVDGADLVHEVIQEDLTLKQDLFKRLDQLCTPDVVLASNTSSFLLSHLCRDVVHKERVVGIHYITPAHIVQAVEIIVADFTPAELIAWARAFVAQIDHVAIVEPEIAENTVPDTTATTASRPGTRKISRSMPSITLKARPDRNSTSPISTKSGMGVSENEETESMVLRAI